MQDERERFEKWVTDMEPAYATSNLERMTGGRGGYRIHNVAYWWMAWQAAIQAERARIEAIIEDQIPFTAMKQHLLDAIRRGEE